jgi:hypothetical protein
VTAGECVFLPRREPHAWLITSDQPCTGQARRVPKGTNGCGPKS